jgi:hypothetical protein
MKQNYHAAILLLLFCLNNIMAQESFSKGQVIFTAGMGAPHLTKTAVKLITRTDLFKQSFNDVVNVNVTGLNPLSIKGEYGFTEKFGLGLSFATWNLKIDLTDKYNVLSAGQTLGVDSVDVYKFKFVSTSFGIRPNFHFPIKSTQNDIYMGVGIGFTNVSLTVDFNSTDVNRKLPVLDYAKKFSLPGGIYFSPLIGYRHYFPKYLGLFFELGWEKGAIIQGGLSLRIGKINSEKE